MKNNQNLFFSPEEKGRAFSDVLKEVQEYISSKYSTLMVEGGSEEVKQQVKRYITKYICDYRITVKGKTQEQLIDDLYTEMAEFSFLTKYIFGTGIEEIDINSWRDIEIQYNDGRCEKLEEHFESPEHAVNVIRRMLHVSGMVLDNASPAVLGHLSKNIRIAVLKTPLVDEDVGIAASIRIVNPQSLKKENFVDGGTATGEMLDFLAECLRYGISICVAGATSSGKTTLAGWLLTTIPDGKRIFTIENGSRELALVREKDGKVTNSVIHTLTRYSENEKQNIDQDMLLDMALRFNPEIICVGEMRSSEAYTAQESARTGHTVLTTIHSNSCESTYSRMRTLCKRKYDMDDEVLMDLVTEAFPIVVFTSLRTARGNSWKSWSVRSRQTESGSLTRCTAMRSPKIGWKGTALSLTARIRRCAEFPRASKRDFWKTACQKMCWKELKKEGRKHADITGHCLHRDHYRGIPAVPHPAK